MSIQSALGATASLPRAFEDLLPDLRRSTKDIELIGTGEHDLGVLIDPRVVDVVLAHGAKYFEKGARTQYWRTAIGDGTGIRPPLQAQETGDPEIDISLASWRRFRRRSMSEQFSAAKTPAYSAIAGQLADDLCRRWIEAGQGELIADSRLVALDSFVACFAGPATRPELVAVSEQLWKSRIAAKLALDTPLACPFDRNLRRRDRARLLLQAAVRPALAPLVKRVMVMERSFKSVVRSATEASDDSIFSLLAQASGNYLSPIPAQTLPAQMQGLFIAGTETLSSALTWVLWHLSTDPALQDRINALPAAEADALLRSSVYESLRLHPPAWSIPREALADLKIGGTTIRKGTTLIASPLIQHYDAQVYDQPDQFVADRFVKPPRPSGSYFPFSLGPRTCPAMNHSVEHVFQICRRVVRTVRLVCVEQPEGGLTHWLGVDLGITPGQRAVVQVEAR
ncbi:cytochrome P450 [Kribbella sp. NPDC023855]|uniref:cytochrome P450 n=1 Tax=Kribbella sp. NPDC023855 TaxID=3154698 RepID=UPI00340953BF